MDPVTSVKGHAFGPDGVTELKLVRLAEPPQFALVGDTDDGETYAVGVELKPTEGDTLNLVLSTDEAMDMSVKLALGMAHILKNDELIAALEMFANMRRL